MAVSNCGSTWRIWDFHTHTPASYKWRGARLRNASDSERQELVEKTIEAMNAAEPSVFIVMDYWTFDGYFALAEYLANNPGALAGKTIFPGIEFRVESSLKERLNVHGVFDPLIQKQELQDFVGTLKLSLRSRERPLSDACFIEWSRELGADKLARHGIDADAIRTDDAAALVAGWDTALVTPQSAREAFEQVGAQGLILMPWDTHGGLRGIDFAQHYAEVRRLLQSAEIFECRDQACRDAFRGRRTEQNAGYFANFWAAIEEKPRLCIRGTDAHAWHDYGKFPENSPTWIKADPTFEGLKQAIREPAFRSYIGPKPPKKMLVEGNGSLFLRRLEVRKVNDANHGEKWFDGVSLDLNPDLIAVVGNKGSGKSGLAEVLAAVGNSKAHLYFTFLNNKRFKSGGSLRASSFEAKATWASGEVAAVRLDSGPSSDEPERVTYISQTYFEELCNEHVGGRSDRFGEEIRKVLFSNMPSEERQSFATLDEYLAAREEPALERVEALRARLRTVADRIADLERQGTPAHEADLLERLKRKQLALNDLMAREPKSVPAPGGDSVHTPEAKRLAEVESEIGAINEQLETIDKDRRERISRRNALTRATQRLEQFERQAVEFDAEVRAELATAGLTFERVVAVDTKASVCRGLISDDELQLTALADTRRNVEEKKTALETERVALQDSLDGPSRAYQQYVVEKQRWDEACAEVVGAAEQSDTIKFYEFAIEALKKLPEQKSALCKQRDAIATEIFNELDHLATSRRALFEPVDRIVAEFPAIKDDLKVAFQSAVFFNRATFREKFFQLVKQNTGGFRGEEDGPRRLEEILREGRFDTADSAVLLMRRICDVAAQVGSASEIPLQQVMRVGKSTSDLYCLLFGLEDLDAKFSLSLAGTTIQQLSPGQRGALLLIFYLLVDNERSPLILDQPEENLDNQTVYSMLVPIIQKAKERRQIVMVTHNANLAVCCDAEQIIRAEFDRLDGFALTYIAGSIEDPAINSMVVDVLEGTRPAFVNRSVKYVAG